MVYQDNSGCDTTFYKVCSESQWFSMYLRIQKHLKSSSMAVSLSLKSTRFTVHVGILAVEADLPKVSGRKPVIYECLVADITGMIS